MAQAWNQFYALWLSCAGSLALVLIGVAWKRRTAPGALGVIAFLSMVTCWTLTYAAHWASDNLEMQHIWLALSFGAALISPVSIWFLVKSFIEPARAAPWYQWLGLSLLPAVSGLVLLLNDPWGLMFGPRAEWTGHSLLHGGSLFIAGLIYGYIIIALSLLRLARVYAESVGMYRTQIGLLLLGMLVPLLGLAIELLWRPFAPELDATPFLFLITGGLFLYGVLGFKLLDLVPVARHLLIEQLPDGVVLLDQRRRVIDFNRAARQVMARDVKTPLGLSAERVFGQFPAAIQILADLREQQGRLAFKDGRTFEFRISAVSDERRVVQGHLVTWRDITEQEQAANNLRLAHEELQGRFEEIQTLQAKVKEQSLRDPLTGLYNRRFLQEQLAALASAEVNEQGYSVLLFDIDHFKRINDIYGHGGGDCFLCQTAFLLQNVMAGALACRYGGEEFLLLLPATSMAQGQALAEQIRHEVAQMVVDYQSHRLSASVSVGIAHFPEDGQTPETVLRAADHALYVAKESGRNRVCAANQGA